MPRSKASIAPRIIKVGIFAVSAAAIVAAILSVQNPLDLFTNAKASLTAPSGGQPPAIPSATAQLRPAPEPVVAVRTASADPAATEIQPNLGARGLSPSAKGGPTRDEIASAFRTARQDQPEVRLPPAAVAPPAAAPAAPAAVTALPPAAAFPPPTADLPAAAAPTAKRLAPDELAGLLDTSRETVRRRSGVVHARRPGMLHRVADHAGDAGGTPDLHAGCRSAMHRGTG